jgi:hypothetical protein
MGIVDLQRCKRNMKTRDTRDFTNEKSWTYLLLNASRPIVVHVAYMSLWLHSCILGFGKVGISTTLTLPKGWKTIIPQSCILWARTRNTTWYDLLNQRIYEIISSFSMPHIYGIFMFLPYTTSTQIWCKYGESYTKHEPLHSL